MGIGWAVLGVSGVMALAVVVSFVQRFGKREWREELKEEDEQRGRKERV